MKTQANSRVFFAVHNAKKTNGTFITSRLKFNKKNIVISLKTSLAVECAIAICQAMSRLLCDNVFIVFLFKTNEMQENAHNNLNMIMKIVVQVYILSTGMYFYFFTLFVSLTL